MSTEQSGDSNEAQSSLKTTQALLIEDVPVDVLKSIKTKGQERSPRVDRNALILYLLERFAAGDVEILSERKGAA